MRQSVRGRFIAGSIRRVGQSFQPVASATVNARPRPFARPVSFVRPVSFDARPVPLDARPLVPRIARAFDRRRWLLSAGAGVLGLAWARRAGALGDDERVRLGRLLLPDLPDPHPGALRRLAWELERRTSLVTAAEPMALRATDPELFRHPMMVMTGDRAFSPPSDADVIRLRRYLTYGGFLLIDSAEGRAGGGFDDSVRKLLARTLPGDLPARVPDEHVLWKSFYILRGPAGRIAAAPYVEGVERERRLALVYTQNDLMGALDRDGFGRWQNEVIPGGEAQREQAFRFAVNTVMYAFCLDYKMEQAHIDFIFQHSRRGLRP